MTKNRKIIICALIAFIFGAPFNWIQYKGGEMITIFQVFDLGNSNMFFDFTLLAINVLFLYVFLSAVFKLKQRKAM